MKYKDVFCTEVPPCNVEWFTIKRDLLKNPVVAVESDRVVRISIRYKDKKFDYKPTLEIRSGTDGKSGRIMIFSHTPKSLDLIEKIPPKSTIYFQLEKSSWKKPLVVKLIVRE